MDHELKVVKLHDFPYLIEQAALLLNSEWPRSLAARCHSLSNSADDLPCSLLLLQVSDGNVPKVVGYSCLSKVLQKPKSVLIESVVVDTVLRGHGLGRLIMAKTEDLAQKLGYETTHLSTHDKYTFYKYLGYNDSIAISPVRKVSKFLSEALIEKHDNDYHEISTKTPVLTDCAVLEQADIKKRVEKRINHLQQDVTTFPSPPPPPPLPQKQPFQSRITSQESALGASTERKRDNIGEHKRVIWMIKYL